MGSQEGYLPPFPKERKGKKKGKSKIEGEERKGEEKNVRIGLTNFQSQNTAASDIP